MAGCQTARRTGTLKVKGPPRLSLWIVAAVSALPAGCRVGPDYRSPCPPLPPAWKHASEAEPAKAARLSGPWWSEFQDPVLDELIRRAVAANPGLHEACFRVLESRARRQIVTSKRLPAADGVGDYSFKKVSGNSSPYALTAQDSYSLFSAGFDAAWELDLWGKHRRATEAADARISVASSDYNAVLLTLLGDVAATYVELRMYQQLIRVARQNLSVQEESLRLAKKRHAAGMEKPIDVTQAQSNFFATKAAIPSLEVALQQTENRLCVLLGEPPRELRSELAEPRSLPTAPREISLGLPTSLLRRRPDIRSAEREVAAESAQIGVAVADLYPQLSLNGTISVDSTDIPTLFTAESIAHNIGPSLTWKILNFGRIRGAIRAQEARFQQAAWRYRSTVLSAVEEVENALTSYVKEQQRSESLQKAVEGARESVRLAQLYYDKGLVMFQTVLDSQRSLLSLQDQLVRSRTGVSLNRIALYKALGGGWQAASTELPPSRQATTKVKRELTSKPDSQPGTADGTLPEPKTSPAESLPLPIQLNADLSRFERSGVD